MAHLYETRRSRGLVWADASDGHCPNEAIIVGYESNGLPVFVARAQHDGDTIPGKLVPSMHVSYIPHGNVEHKYSSYQVLTNPKHKNLSWVWSSNGHIPSNAIIGGQESDGTPLYIGRTNFEGSIASGKIHQGMGKLYFGFSDVEHSSEQYEVLVKNN